MGSNNKIFEDSFADDRVCRGMSIGDFLPGTKHSHCSHMGDRYTGPPTPQSHGQDCSSIASWDRAWSYTCRPSSSPSALTHNWSLLIHTPEQLKYSVSSNNLIWKCYLTQSCGVIMHWLHFTGSLIQPPGHTWKFVGQNHLNIGHWTLDIGLKELKSISNKR